MPVSVMTRKRLRIRLGSPLAMVLLAEVALVVLFGVLVVVKQPLGLIDERPHTSYVQTIAEDHQLPVFGKTCMRSDLLALPWFLPPLKPGACEPSHEAFQPPLAYLVAAPAWAATPGGDLTKLRVVRLVSLLELLAAMAILLAFLRSEFPDRWIGLAALTTPFFLWPGVLVRNATVTNGSLELLMATAFLAAAWRAVRVRSNRWLLAAGALLGLSLLTKLTLIWLAPLYAAAAIALWLSRRDHSAVGAGLLGAVLALAILSPWLAFNHSHYGTLTANHLAQRAQEPHVNPGHHHFTATEVPAMALSLVDVLPEEWGGGGAGASPSGGLKVPGTPRLAVNLLVLIGLGALIVFGLRDDRRRYRWLLVPAALALVTMAATLLAQNWAIFLPRYLYPALPPLVVALAVATTALVRSRRRVELLSIGLATAFALLFLAEAHIHYAGM